MPAAVHGRRLTVTTISTVASDPVFVEVESGAEPVAFVGADVVLASGKGLDHVSGETGVHRSNWRKDLLVVVGTRERSTVGLSMRDRVARIVDVAPARRGFDTADADGRLLACRTDGSKATVALPAGVTPGWEIVPAYGVNS